MGRPGREGCLCLYFGGLGWVDYHTHTSRSMAVTGARTVGRPVVGHAAPREQGQAVKQAVNLEGGLVDRQDHGALAVGEAVRFCGTWLVCVCG